MVARESLPLPLPLMSPTLRIRLLYAFTALQCLGLLTFSKGFFPYKVLLSGSSSLEHLPPAPTFITATAHPPAAANLPLPEPQFDRLVFMLVDALRSDFVSGNDSGFTFTRSLLASGKARGYTAIATAPTVTLPRIKALTTGSVPNFLDAILNIAESDTSSTMTGQDSWVNQMVTNGKKNIAFYGDDTWLKLFPGMFFRSEGTTSFYVSDTIQVDLNVTRNVRPELNRTDWDALILHYLGLDHIGHLGGPRNPIMLPKQKEMDDVVSTIYKTLAEQDKQRKAENADAKPTLFVLCGDHGMNEVGNHGGSSQGEVSTVFVFMSSLFEEAPPATVGLRNDGEFSFPTVDQVDLAPTLTFLFGLPTPMNNLGKVILDIFVGQKETDQLRVLQLNSHQLCTVLYAAWPELRRDPVNLTIHKDEPEIDTDCSQLEIGSADRFVCWQKCAIKNHAKALSGDGDAFDVAKNNYQIFLNEAGALMSLSFSNYDLRLLVAGFLISLFTNISLLYFYLSSSKLTEGGKTAAWMGAIIAAANGLTSFASSFVEEEHEFWYFMASTLWLGHIFLSFRKSVNRLLSREVLCTASYPFAQLCIFRIMRSWNQTGVKYAFEIDFRHYLTSTHTTLSWTLFLVTLVSVPLVGSLALVYAYKVKGQTSKGSWLLCIGTSAMLFRISFLVGLYKLESGGGFAALGMDALRSVDTRLIPIAREAYISIGVATGFGVLAELFLAKKHEIGHPHPGLRIMHVTLISSITLLLVLLSRPHNAPLFALSFIQLVLLRAFFRRLSAIAADDPTCYTPVMYITLLIVTQTSFFLFGGSNSLATVDIGNSYTGVEGFSPVVVGYLTFLVNWAGPLWWSIASCILISDNIAEEPGSATKYLAAKNIDCETSHRDPIAEKYESSLNSRRIEARHTEYLFVQAIFRSMVTTILSLSVTILRSHLFIWSVFSPRWLYETVWVLGFGVGNALLVGSLR